MEQAFRPAVEGDYKKLGFSPEVLLLAVHQSEVYGVVVTSPMLAIASPFFMDGTPHI